MTAEYMVARDGEQFGPYEPNVLLDYLAQGHIVLDDHVWCEGMADWETFSSMKEQVERDVAQAATIQSTTPSVLDLPPPALTVLDTQQTNTLLPAEQITHAEPAAATKPATIETPLAAPTVLDAPQENVLPSTAQDTRLQGTAAASDQSLAAPTVLDTHLPAPTVLDGPQASALRRPAAQPTQRDTAAAAATQRDAPTGHAEIPELPPALAARYRVVRLLARGGEGFVLLAEGLAGEGQRVIKLYVPNTGSTGPKGAVLDNVSAEDKAHVVHIHEHGKEGVWYYEVQEYVANGSLRKLMTGPQPLTTVETILRELADALACLHGAKLIHRDLKPENILVRSRFPLDLVLTDFGIASVSEATLHETTRSRTALYSSPEAMTGIVSEKSDWWSIGIILVELLTGRHPLAGIGSQNRLDFWIAQHPIDTEGINETRWRTPCRGLLVRDAAKRWGSDEVGRWLAGETVAVADDSGRAAEPVTHSEAAVSYRPYTISGTACATPRALATALLQFWDEGVKHLSRGLILKWVQDEVKDYDLSSHLIDLAEGNLTPDARLAALVYRIDPGLPPVWKGRDASYSAILAWANDAQTSSDGREALFQLVTTGLPVYPHADLKSFSQRVTPAVARLEELWPEAARFLKKTRKRKPVAPEMASLLPRLILALEHPPALDQLRISVKQWANDGSAPTIPAFLSAEDDDAPTLLLIAYLREFCLAEEKVAADSSGKATNQMQVQCKRGHVEEVTRCPECHGKGRHKCSSCKGKKGAWITCGGGFSSGCKGTGLDRPCRRCRGTGTDPNHDHTCICGGTGSDIADYRWSHLSRHVWHPNAPCPACEGRREVFEKCRKCEGFGIVDCESCLGKGYKPYICDKCKEMEREQAEIDRKEEEETASRLEQVRPTIRADIAAWKHKNYGVWVHGRAIVYGIAVMVGLINGLAIGSTPRQPLAFEFSQIVLVVSLFAVPLGFKFVTTKYADIDFQKALRVAAVTTKENARLAEGGSDAVKKKPHFSTAKAQMETGERWQHYFCLIIIIVMSGVVAGALGEWIAKVG